MNDWTVTTTELRLERFWGIRFEWTGWNTLLAVQVNVAPAIRITLFGWSLYAGRLLAPPKKVTLNLDDIALSKGWNPTR